MRDVDGDVDGWKPNRSALSSHANSNDHKIDWVNIKILTQETKIKLIWVNTKILGYYKCKLLESFYRMIRL